MIPKVTQEIIDLGDGRTISIETGKLAKQADGSVVVRMGDAMLLATAVSARTANPGVDFLPLTVDYREKFAAAGRFPGGFFKREARPSDGEVLTMRLVDRVLRPLFPKDYHAETQVMIQLMSHDEDVMPDAMAGLAASAAIQLSDFPFECAISEARVGRINGQFVINPSRAQLEESDIDMVIGASADSVMMVEGEMKEISEEEMVEAIKFAHEHIKKQCEAQLRLAEAVGKKVVVESGRQVKAEQADEPGGKMEDTRQADDQRIRGHHKLQQAVNVGYIPRRRQQIIIDQAVQQKVKNAVGHHQDAFAIGFKGRPGIVVSGKSRIIDYGEDHKNKIGQQKEVIELDPPVPGLFLKLHFIQIDDHAEHKHGPRYGQHRFVFDKWQPSGAKKG